MSRTAKRRHAKKITPKTGSSRGRRGAARRATPTVEDLRPFARSEAAKAYLRDPNITSVGIGYKSVPGEPGEVLSIQFTVGKKVLEPRPEAFAALGTTPIPKTIQVGEFTVPTDVIQREFRAAFELVEVEAKDRRKQRLQTLSPGISVSHPKGTAGTLGLIVYDRRSGAPCMLSNWHVLHGPEGELGDPTVQPGPFDDNRIAQNRAGALLRSHLGLAGDCAIARIEGRGIDPEVLDLGTVVTRLARPSLRDRVVKSGRTTGVTFGAVTRIDVTSRIDYGGSVGEQLVGGFEIGPIADFPPPDNEVSMGGDSGSAWLVAQPNGTASDILVGLHFAGEADDNPHEHALACYAHSVFEKLEIDLAPPSGASGPGVEITGTGYDERFLGVAVPVPTLHGELEGDAFKIDGTSLIPYTHFTVALSKSRRMARFVAWNVDGARLRRESRNGLDFDFDSRIPERFQIGNDVYVDNKLDRGHLARRADLVWGDRAEARRANRQSFLFPNITPQHQAFNQSSRGGLWGELEDAIFEDVDVHDLRLAVLAGPIFKERDREYRGALVPSDFWKLICFVDDQDGQAKAKAYVITQDDLLDDIEALDLDAFRLYQVSIAELERLTDLRFPGLRSFDDFQRGRVQESLSSTGKKRPVREVRRREDVVRG